MAASIKASKAGLERVDQSRIKKGWTKYEEAWAHRALTSPATLRRFWSKRPIQQSTFIDICREVGISDWEEIADFSQPSKSTTDSLVERAALVNPLIGILQGKCRILALAGMTGIGKTTLAEHLAVQLSSSSAASRLYSRLNLDYDGMNPEFSASGVELLRSLGEEPTPDEQKDGRILLKRLLYCLRSRPYCVLIDSVERLLQRNDQDGWSTFQDRLWDELFQQLLSGNECQSQLILTTQDVPASLQTHGTRYPQFWHCQTIEGLTQSEQLKLFEKQGLIVDDDAARDYLVRIGNLYTGHPLVLRVIAAELKTNRHIDVARYWKICHFDELEEKRPAQSSRRALQVEVQQQVKRAIGCLPNTAYQLLCRSAVYRRPVPESFWFAMLPEKYTKEQQNAALNLLKSCALAEEDWEPNSWLGVDESIPVRQHTLVRSVAYDLLVADCFAWRMAEQQAARQWRRSYQPSISIPNLEKVRGYLEAFEHYCNLEDWENAAKILLYQRYIDNSCINSNDFVSLGWQLGDWGYYQQQVKVHKRLLELLDKKLGRVMKQQSLARLECLNTIGTAYIVLGSYPEAVNYFHQAQETARRKGDQAEGILLGNLGFAYSSIGNYHEAIEVLQAALNTIKKTSNPTIEASILGNLGQAYSYLGNYQKAIEHYEQQLSIANKIKDYRNEGYALKGLGMAYRSLNNFSKAEECHQKQLAIAVKYSYRDLEGIALGGLGDVCYHLGDYLKAIEYYQCYVDITQTIGTRQSEACALMRLGEVHIKLEKYEKVRGYLETALKISKAVGNRSDQAESLRLLSTLQEKQGNNDLALELCYEALTIIEGLETPIQKACLELKVRLERLKSKE